MPHELEFEDTFGDDRLDERSAARYEVGGGRLRLLIDEVQEPWLYTPQYEPERSGEICVCELFGRDVGPDRGVVGVGVHPFGDPTLDDGFSRATVPIDAREPHLYSRPRP